MEAKIKIKDIYQDIEIKSAVDKENNPKEKKAKTKKLLLSKKKNHLQINFKKKFLFNYSLTIILFGFIFLFFPKKVLTYEHYIILKVNQPGYQQILSDEYSGKNPSAIYIKDEVKVLYEKKIYVENITYEIKLEWDNSFTNFSYMFYNLTNITYALMYYISGNNCNMSYMFYNCKNLENFIYNYDYYSYHAIKDTISMFYNCISLKSFNFYFFRDGYYNYDNYLRNMSYMFYNCHSLTSIYNNDNDIKYIVDMRGMFYNCTSLSSINLDYFITNSNNYVNASYMLYNCQSLKSLTFSKNYFYTNDMKSMFYNCQSLTSINLYHIRTNVEINVSRLFYNCNKLNSIKGDFYDFRVFDLREMFYNCTSLKNYINNNNYQYNYLNFYINNNNNNIQVNMSNMFYNCKDLGEVRLYRRNYYSNIYPSDFHSMFYNCISLTSIYFSNFYIDYTQDMSYMFYNCKQLQFFNRYNFYIDSTLNVVYRTMKGMFQNCESLKSLYLNENFTTINVDNMWDMFKGCSKLQILKVDNPKYFNTSQVTDMQSMFEGCSSLVSLNISSFNTTNVLYMNKMFYNCTKLESLNFSSISAYSLGTMYQMFYNCKSLKYLNLYNLTEKSQSFLEMFKGASTSFQFCIEENENIPNIFNELYNMSGTRRDCSTNCYKKKRVSIESKKLCCPKKEFNSNCYDECPSRTRVTNNDNICKNFSCPYQGLNSNYKYYNYDQSNCINNIPDGYFINDTKLNTIDKCHSDCLTCDEKEIDEYHTNCKSCKGSKPNIYLGNCYDKCLKGNYTEDGKVYCKCFDERCLKCTEEYIKDGLCSVCNTGYYPKNYNQKAPYKCYKNPEKYYLSENVYYPCYSSCQTCDRKGTEEVHNCQTCNINNTFALSKNDFYNCYPNCTYYFFFDKDNKNVYTCTKSPDCPEKYDLMVPEIGQCVQSCLDTDDFQYEFKGNCYRWCPPDTNILDEDKKTCKLSCPFERPFVLVEQGICVSSCSIENRRDKLCTTNYFGNKTNFEIQDQVLNDIENQLTNNKFDYTQIKNGSIIIEEANTNYEITTTQNTANSDLTSTIDLSQCEEGLREFYSIPPEDVLYILKYDIYLEGKEGPTVRYRVYYPLQDEKALEALELTICEDLAVIISLPVNITGDPDLYDKNSAYYNDLCAHYSFDNGIDMTLEDRQRQYVENNKSLCEEDCNFVGYDKKTGKVDCSCEIKFNLPLISEIKVDKDKLYKFMDIKKIANLNVLKCWKLITSKVGLITNIGFYLYFPAVITFFLAIIILIAKDYKHLKIQVDDIVYAKQYIKLINEKKKKKEKPKEKKPKKEKPKEQKKPRPKYVEPIILQMFEQLEEDKKAKKKQEPNLKNIIADILKKDDLIDENNINNEKFDNNRKKDLINDKIDISNNKENKNLFPPKKNNNPKIVKTKNLSLANTEGNPDKKGIITKENDLKIDKRGNLITTYNNINNDKKNGKLSKEEEERIRVIMKHNDSELNVLDYKDAIKYDDRGYFQYYCSLLKSKHMTVKIFSKTDYNSRMIKIFILFFNFALCIAVNALFFTDNTMHKILLDGGDFNIIYQLPQIIYSAIISFIFENILNFFALSEENLLSIKHEKNYKIVKRKAEEVFRTLQMKFLSFFILSFCFLMMFWYYVTCFCAVYSNTQFHLIKDSLISFGTSQITPLGLNLLPGLFRIPGLKRHKEFLYLISKIIQLF